MGRRVWAAAWAVGPAWAAAGAQPAVPPGIPPTESPYIAPSIPAGGASGDAPSVALAGDVTSAGDERVRAYLASRGLDRLLSVELRRAIDRTTGAAQRDLAEELARLYARLLAAATSGEERRELEELAIELTERVPAGVTDTLRLALAEATYAAVAETCERHRLGLAADGERDRAIETLRSLIERFAALAQQAERDVQRLEPRELRGPDGSARAIDRQRLDDARQVRSRANYHAGWARYYLGLLTGDKRSAEAALSDFGSLLTGPGEAPAIDRLAPELLVYEHLAWSAVGVALCKTLLGQAGVGAAWLAAVDLSPELDPRVRDQLFRWRIVVMTAAQDWSALEAAVSARRGKDAGSPLSMPEARLLAMQCLDALRGQSGQGPSGPAASARSARGPGAQRLAEAALGDLVRTGHAGHVLDLAEQYGTLPLGVDGFVPLYVRGLQAHAEARQAHEATGGDPSTPPPAGPLRDRYGEAARLLGEAFESAATPELLEQQTEAGLLSGWCFMLAGRTLEAVDRYERVARSSSSAAQRERALWLGITALDGLIASEAAERPQGHAQHARSLQLATLYLQQFPGTERAALLVMKGAAAPSEAQSIEILFQVSPESAVFGRARLHLAQLLYRRLRSTPAASRAAYADQFLAVAEEVLDRELAQAAGATGQTLGRDMAPSLTLLVRQMLAVAPLSSASAERSAAAFAGADRLVSLGVDLGELTDELQFRRAQLAVTAGDLDAAERHAGVLGASSPFAKPAAALLFNEARRQFGERASDELAQRVLRHGAALLPVDAGALDATGGGLSIAEGVAAAAAHLALGEGPSIRDAAAAARAIELDGRVIALGVPSEALLRRHALLCELTGRAQDAAGSWLRLASASAGSTPVWFEARYNAMRLTAMIDAARAIAMLDQHRSLHPTLGPSPWGERIAELDRATRRSQGTGSGGAPVTSGPTAGGTP